MIQARICILYLAAAGGVAVAQTYSGAITTANCGSITGTATVNGQPSEVDLWSDGVYIGTASASAILWTFTTPATLKDNQVHVISAMYTGSSSYSGAPVPLAKSPQSLECTTSSLGYHYSFTDPFPAPSFSTHWTVNGTATINSPGGGFSTGSTLQSTGSVIATAASNITPPTPPSYLPNSDYEVSTTLTIVPSAQGGRSYIQYLRASSGAPYANSTYFAVSLTTNCQPPSPCTATLSAYEITSVR